MDTFLNYIIEAGMSLGVFTLVYWFFLRGETRFKATRFYLLFALLFSSLLPFFTIRIYTAATVVEPMATDAAFVAGTNLLEAVTVYAAGIPAKIGSIFLQFDYTMLFYAFGAFAALFVIFTGIFQLWRMVSKSRVFRLKEAKLVVSQRDIAPYSFFNYIFIGKKLTGKENWKAIVHHELEHVKQGHSFDVLFVDFMMVFQWFNPFYWILRHLVRENHEFLADTGVLSKGLISNSQYKMLLLAQAIGGRPVITSNFLNLKTVKKRFKMITNKNKRKFGVIKYTIGIVTALALTLVFACERSETLLSTENGIQYIFEGKQISVEDFEAMESNFLISDVVDQMEVITAYPNLNKRDLKAEKYKLVFEMGSQEHIEILRRLEIKIAETKINRPVASNLNFANSGDGSDEVFVIVEQMPQFPGGEEGLRQWIGSNVRYPHAAAENGIQGRVFVAFVVGADGSVSNARIARGVDPALDEEALRVVNQMPKWATGKQRGQNVAVAYTVPISFALN